MRKKISTILGITVLSILFAVVFLLPSLSHFTTQFIGDGGDNYEYASYMGYSASQISSGHFPLTHTNFWRYPAGIDFGRSFDSYLTLFIGIFWTLLFHLPLGYNMTVITLMTLNGICSFILFRRVSGKTSLGIVGMLVYGFSVYPIAKSGAHMNLLFIGGFPLFLYFVIETFTKPTPTAKTYFPFGLSVLLIAMGSLQYLALLIISVLIALPLLILFYRPLWDSSLRKLLQTFGSLLIGGGFSFGIFLIFFSPHLLAMLAGTFQFVGREGALFSTTPHISNFFFPNSYLQILSTHIKPATSLSSIEFAVFLGWAELVVFFCFLVTKTLHKRFRLFLFSLFMIPFLFSLGYGKENMFFLLPYRFLSELPLFKIMAEPGRYFVIFYLYFTLGIVLFFKHMPQKMYMKLIIGVFVLLVLLERFPTQTKMSPNQSTQPYVSVVATSSTNAVLDLPMNIYHPRYNILSLAYKKPIVGGYFHWSADGINEKSFLVQSTLLSRYSCSDHDPILDDGMDDSVEAKQDTAMLQLLKTQGIKTLVIHKDDKFYHPVCKNLRMRLGRLIPHMHEANPGLVSKPIAVTIVESKPSFQIYFPKDGIFYLDGVYIAPNTQAEFTITSSDGKAIPYTWHPTGSPYAFEMLPKDTIQFQVSSGSTVTFSSQTPVPSTYISVWYRYKLFEDAHTKPFTHPFKILFEDANTVVYQL